MPGDMLEQFVRAVTKKHAGDAAEVSRSYAGKMGDATMINLHLSPQRSGAATIDVTYDPTDIDQFYLSCGRATRLEPTARDGRYTSRSGLEETEGILRAVFAGQFRETLYLKNGKVVRYTSVLELEGRSVRFLGSAAFANPFRRLEKQEVRYDRY